MKKVIFFAIAMALPTAVIAVDFRALGNIQAAPVQDRELAATEGGLLVTINNRIIPMRLVRLDSNTFSFSYKTPRPVLSNVSVIANFIF